MTRVSIPAHRKAASPALLTVYFLLSGHKRCHFPPQTLAPSNRPCKRPITAAQSQSARHEWGKLGRGVGVGGGRAAVSSWG